MIVDLNIREIEAIIDALQFQMVESDSLDDFDDVTNEEVDTIFNILEGSVDKYYDKIEKARKKQPDMEW